MASSNTTADPDEGARPVTGAAATRHGGNDPALDPSAEPPGPTSERSARPLPAGLAWMTRLWPVWTGVMAVALVAGIVHQYPTIAAACAGPTSCGRYQVDARTAAALGRHGIGLGLYAWVVTSAHLALASVLFLLGYLMMRRSDRELLPVLAGWVFPALGATFFVRESVSFEVGWFSPLLFAAFVVNRASFVPVFALFPNGYFVPRWIRWFVYVDVPWELVQITALATDRALPGPLVAASSVFTTAAYLCLVGAQVMRYRRWSDPIGRRQIRWVLAGLLAVVLVALVIMGGTSLLAPPDQGSWPWVAREVLGAGAALILFATFSVAIIRFRLWGIDVVVQRVLVWGTLSVGILAVYIAAVGLSTGVLDAERSGLPALAVALVIAVALQPARRRVQRLADRAVYGRRDEPVAITAGMGELFDDVSRPDELLAGLAELIARELKLPSVSMTVELSDGTEVEGGHGGAPADAEFIELRVGADRVGTLVVGRRRGEHRLSAQDRQTLTIVGHQAAALAGMLRFAFEREAMRRLVVDARDGERRRLRRDLHDGLGPTLASVVQRVDAAARGAGVTPATARLLDDANAGLRDALGEMRRIVNALRPPLLDQHGLVGALRRNVDRHDGVGVVPLVVFTSDPIPVLADSTELALFRIAEEAVLNARRHAHANRVEVSLRGIDGDLVLEVRDDGLGFPSSSRQGVGIAAMRERAAEVGGRFEITEREGGGTVVTALLPGMAPR
jgi:signal transduction histidine kinase